MTPAAQAPATFESLYQTYAAGDYDVVVRALPNRRAYQAFERDAERARLAWMKKDWRRPQAALLLEIATVAFRQRWPDRTRLLADACELVIARPAAPGATRDDDIFEMIWHRAALAVLQGSLESRLIEQYLDQILTRIGVTPATVAGKSRLVDERLALIRAMAAEQALVPGVIYRQQPRLLSGRVIETTTLGATPLQVATALERLTEAGTYEGNTAEAAIRRANVLIRTNRAADALPILEAHAGTLTDRLLQYWRDLLRARALDVLNRLDEAAQAYGDARALAPSAQSPLLALGVLHFRQGNLAEAQQFTGLVQQLPPDAEDPWSLYWFGDSRFFPNLLTALREMAAR